MKEFFKDKSKASGMCAFFAMIVAMCIVSSYYLQYSSDIYWVKLFTYGILLVCGACLLAFSVVNKEKTEKNALISLIVILVFAIFESIAGVMGRADLRVSAEAIAFAAKAFGSFIMLDAVTFKTNLMKKWWYILIGVILLLVPAILKTLSLCVTSLSTGFIANNIEYINIIMFSAGVLFGLVAFVFSVIKIVKKQDTNVAWATLIYDLSIVLFGVFGALRILGFNLSQWSRNTAMLFEVAVVVMYIIISTYTKTTKKKVTKKQ